MRSLALALLLTAVPSLSLAAADLQQAIESQYPIPDAKYVSPETNIMLRPGGPVTTVASTGEELLDVRGSKSGPHRGRLLVAEDGGTGLFDPDAPFLPGETVRVRIAAWVPVAGRVEQADELSLAHVATEKVQIAAELSQSVLDR